MSTAVPAVAWRSGCGDVVESRDLGPDPGDRVLLQRAAVERRVLITMDRDFGALLFGEGASHAGLVRLPDVPSTTRVALMNQVLQSYGPDLDRGAVVTVRGGRIRVSRSDVP